MAGGAGARRGTPHLQNPNQTQGPPSGPPQQYYQAGPQQGQQGPPAVKPRSGGFDGPGELTQRGPNPYGPGLGYDPAKPKPVAQKVITNTRVELPASAYKLEGGSVSYNPSFFLVFSCCSSFIVSGGARVWWCFEGLSCFQEALVFKESNCFESVFKVLARSLAGFRGLWTFAWGSCSCPCPTCRSKSSCCSSSR